MFDELDIAAVLAGIGDAARAENIACARRLALIAELYERRRIPVEDDEGRELWLIDPWEAVSAEVGAAMRITSTAAGALLHDAVCLRERLPKVAEVFATGTISYKTVRLIVTRTLLALEPEVVAAIDADLAEELTALGRPLSRNKTEQFIDALVQRHDPEAVRRTESVARGRHVDIDTGGTTGGAILNGELYGTDGSLLDRRLTALAHSVCDQDPRTVDQRRADALGALAAGLGALPCACARDHCPAGEDDERTPRVVVHVVTTEESLAADTTELHGERPGDGREIITTKERLDQICAEAARPSREPRPSTAPCIPSPGPAAVLGGPLVPAAVIADLVKRRLATVRPVRHPGDSPPEPRYRPSTALADFVRCRDLTCRFPECDVPADSCDIDHTVPYPFGPTHASNLKCGCRKHHLLKTFWVGPTGWSDQQFPDGTVVWTSPSGHTYRTEPGSRLLLPALCVPTGTLPAPPRWNPRWNLGGLNRGAMMPRRQEPRTESRRRRILAERQLNANLA
jgi:hypothetical protein